MGSPTSPKALTSTSDDCVSIDPQDSHHPGPNFREDAGEDLCSFCQDIPFREQEYLHSAYQTPYRAQERHGRMRLFSKRGLMIDEWIPALAHWIDLDVGYERTDAVPGLPSITTNAAAGCGFCKFLLKSDLKNRCVRACEEGFDVSTVSISLAYLWRCDAEVSLEAFGIRYLELTAKLGGRMAPGGEKNFYQECYVVVAEEQDPCVKLLGIRGRLPTISFEERLLLMKQWISDCEKQCLPLRLDGSSPTRLLDVGSLDDIHLVDCRGDTNFSEWKYVALSHCWGSPDRPPLQTTKSSLDERSRHIPFETLPKNYQDAITITRGLGLEFLWIDSLCIIQDSIIDWEQESMRMHEVYRNSYLTVIAASGSSCHDGFLDLKPGPRVRLRYQSSTYPSNKGSYFLCYVHDAKEDVERSQWNTRGWTFQEHMFSGRKLYLTAHGFSYWCSHCVASAKYPDPFKLRNPPGTRLPLSDYRFLQIRLPENYSTFFRGWISIVNIYSGRTLTNPKDRLLALSAMAKSYSGAAAGRYKYIAGLWSVSLHLWLLWRCKNVPPNYDLGDRLHQATSDEFVAPSWSWASQSQYVEFDIAEKFRAGCCAVKIAEAAVDVDGSNPYGRVKNGSLRVLGEVREISNIWLEDKVVSFQCRVDEGRGLEMWLDWTERSLDVTGNGQQISCETITNLQMLLVAQDEYPEDNREIGLLLYPAGEDGVYFRVGVFQFRSSWRVGGFFDNCERRPVKII